jgi:hypothetical protein
MLVAMSILLLSASAMGRTSILTDTARPILDQHQQFAWANIHIRTQHETQNQHEFLGANLGLRSVTVDETGQKSLILEQVCSNNNNQSLASGHHLRHALIFEIAVADAQDFGADRKSITWRRAAALLCERAEASSQHCSCPDCRWPCESPHMLTNGCPHL